jgi:hypothetical protein
LRPRHLARRLPLGASHQSPSETDHNYDPGCPIAPPACSGLMKAGVPRAMPVSLSALPLAQEGTRPVRCDSAGAGALGRAGDVLRRSRCGAWPWAQPPVECRISNIPGPASCAGFSHWENVGRYQVPGPRTVEEETTASRHRRRCDRSDVTWLTIIERVPQ